MLEKIKQFADEAVALQNKLQMEAALREIGDLCATSGRMDAEQFEAAELAQHQAAKPAQKEYEAAVNAFNSKAAKRGVKK